MAYNDKYTSILSSSLFMDKKNEPQRTNNFELQITGLNSIVRAGFTKDDANSGYSAAIKKRLEDTATIQELILSIKSAFSPKVSISILEVQYGNQKTKFAGVPTYENGTITWHDYYDQDTELILKAWQAAACDDATGAVGDAADYKRTAYLTMFAPNGRHARRWKLINCWVADVNGDDFSNEGNNIRGLAATFIFDKVIRLESWDTESALTGMELGNTSGDSDDIG
jgi:hypothetical protein